MTITLLYFFTNGYLLVGLSDNPKGSYSFAIKWIIYTDVTLMMHEFCMSCLFCQHVSLCKVTYSLDHRIP